MRLEPLYRVTFTTPEARSVEISGPGGVEGQSFLIAEGRCDGRLSGHYPGANYPRRPVDGALLPGFRGVLETDDGAAIAFAWQGYARPPKNSMRELVGSLTHQTDDDRHSRLNDVVCPLAGKIRPRERGGFEVVLAWSSSSGSPFHR